VRVLVLGGGGREHAIAWRLSRDPDVGAVVSAPGNPGMAGLGRCLPLDLGAPADALELARREHIDLTVVGPEAPLERGVADLFRREGRAIVGPSAGGAELECSKARAKRFMARHGIPTARFRICESADEAFAVVRSDEFQVPLVVKADGLAAGKGVVVAAGRSEAESAVRAAMVDRRFGAAGACVVVEECLTGPEVSFFVLCDGKYALPLGTAQDHKRALDDDRGPNTGGMGAFAPSPLMTPALQDEVLRRVVKPVLDGMQAQGEPYRGFLYVSLMLTAAGPQVIEFNVRFGDPEAQVVMPLLEGRFARLLMASATSGLRDVAPVHTSPERAVGVVLASAGYPGTAETGYPIRGVERAEARSGVLVFQAGTRRAGDDLVTAGGRVLTVVGRGGDYETAMKVAYDAVNDVAFDGMQYRHDIGRKALGS
jgi:phosphoribosylamine---glycine ligase